MNKLPNWIKVRLPSDIENYKKLSSILKEKNLTTVCQEAKCPNIFECFCKETLTFMILGNICTRNCSYCNVMNGKPHPLDRDEPKRVAEVVSKLGLRYVVITCVTRDDLDDGGADIFTQTVQEIRRFSPQCNIELLISDLRGSLKDLRKIIDVEPEVIGHNVEVVKELFHKVRPKGDYKRSLQLLKNVKKYNPHLITKSGMMVGLGETYEQIIRTMKDLVEAGCNIFTIGQYLSPSSKHAPVKKFYTLEEFADLKTIGESLGFDCVESGPLVRSSYRAGESYKRVLEKNVTGD